MVWKWPKFVETAIIPNTSNIRLIRKCSPIFSENSNRNRNSQNDQYWHELMEWTIFHHNFWKLNNHLHSELKAKYESLSETEFSSNFYREFTELRRLDFDTYHLESWKRNFKLLKVGYGKVFGDICKKLRIINSNSNFYNNADINYKFSNKRALIKE